MSNENPIDILGVHPTGAFLRPVDDRDYELDSPEVGMAPAPFDWEAGYDVEKEIGFVLPTKDQGNSSSCGGQTMSEYAQALTTALLLDPSEKSAKAPYCQVYVPGGGSNSRKLADIYVKQGIFREDLVPSYENGHTPSEAFMQRSQDISATARDNAAKTKGLLAYAFPKLDIDSVASAVKAHKGALIGIYGSNNGTWLDTFPAVKQTGSFWAHFMYAGKCEIVDGKKGIWAKQSWGKRVSPSTNAWQFISEDHFNAGRIWDCLVFLKNEVPPHTGHTFTRDIPYGETSDEVRELQAALARDGVFNLAPTGYYGDITAASVVKFRAKHGVDGSTDPQGRTVGPRTRAALNALGGN